MKLDDLPKVDPLARRHDRLTDELKKAEGADLFLGTLEGRGERLSIQLSTENPTFRVLRQVIVTSIKEELAKVGDELRALGVTP